MNTLKTEAGKSKHIACYHCGEACKSEQLSYDDHDFCCNGCKLVYDILKENSLCSYYTLNSNPGVSPEMHAYSGKYDYLNHELIREKLIRFTDGLETHITFYLPQMHCSSCIWLLENLHRLNNEIKSSSVNFLRKEVSLIFNNSGIQLSEIASILASIGYEPLINQQDLAKEERKTVDHTPILKIGLAGFCFGNIMMLSFPEYFSLGNFNEQGALSTFFGYLNLVLALPVFFYSASGFFSSAWKSISNRYLNIDAPIALAILVTFLRSIYEVFSNTGSGYFDSMTGIVFFMLIGRYFQNRTYDTLTFERDYKSYFPIGVTVKKENGIEESKGAADLIKGERIVIHNNELIPSDSILISESTHVDYSFITGESAPVKKYAGELIYAGGKQLDGAIELEILKPVSQSYLTQLWNRDQESVENTKSTKTYLDTINKYFTISVLSIAGLTALFWLLNDSHKVLPAFTAVLIVACPCGLLLTSTFTNGTILSMLGRNKFYLKNASVIHKLTQINTVVFDKTGTITNGSKVTYSGKDPGSYKYQLITSLAAQSSHPLSRKIKLQFASTASLSVLEYEEIPGHGIKGSVNGNFVILGSEYFVTGSLPAKQESTTKVFVMINGELLGFFSFVANYREGLTSLIKKLSSHYALHILSGDTNSETKNLKTIFGEKTGQLFNQTPEEKKLVIQNLKKEGKNVMMIGDGLNDAVALQQSDVGIAVSDDTNNFSPACDAILDGSSFTKLSDFLQVAKAGKNIILGTFILSLFYNLSGLFFAVQGILSPVIAAILMPASSISIVLIATVSTTLYAKQKGL